MKQSEFYQTMVEAYSARSGFVPDEASDTAIRFHTLAEQLALLETRLAEASRQAYPATASGEALDAHAQAWGLARKQAVQASGVLRFTRAKPGAAEQIPAGTTCWSDDGFQYETVRDAAFPPESATVEVLARAVLPGPEGNALAGKVCHTCCWQVTNPSAFSGGALREDDHRLRARLLDAIAHRPNGANGAYYRQLAMAQSGVADAVVSAGTDGGVLVRLAGPDAQPVSAGILAEVSRALNARREPCAVVTVEAAERTLVALSVEAEPSPQAPADWARQLRTALSETVNRLPIGGRLTLAALYWAAAGLTVSFHVTAPAGDQYPAAGKVLRAGEITIRETGAGA